MRYYLICFFSLLMVSGQAIAQNEVQNTLLALGMEEVTVVQDGNICYIAYEDNVYRGTYRGIAAVIEKLHALPNATNKYKIIILDQGIPQVSIILPKNISDLQISYDTDAIAKKLKVVKPANRSAGKLDFVLYPEFFLQNSWLDKLHGVAVGVAPAMEIGLWKGASFTGQVIFPLYTNMTDEKKYIRPGFITFQQSVNLHNNWLGTISVGNFNGDRIGLDAELKYRTNNGSWEIGSRAGLTGSSTFYSGIWEVSKWKRVTGTVWGRYNEPKYGLQMDLQIIRLVYGDMGARFDFSRHFGEVTVGVYAMNTRGETNGGFSFAIPISKRKLSSRKAVRVRLPEYFGREYRARHGGNYGTELLGYSYQTRPDINGSDGYDNPAYIKKQIMYLLK